MAPLLLHPSANPWLARLPSTGLPRCTIRSTNHLVGCVENGESVGCLRLGLTQLSARLHSAPARRSIDSGGKGPCHEVTERKNAKVLLSLQRRRRPRPR